MKYTEKEENVHAESEDISLDKLFDIDELQKLQDQFSRAIGVSAVIAHLDGTPITREYEVNRFCNFFIRGNRKGRKECYQSDAALGRLALDKPAIHRCLGPGFWDGATVIKIREKPIGIWLLGPVRDLNQNEEDIRSYLRSIGADEEEAMKAYRDVPVMDQDRFQSLVDLLSFLANLLSTIAYQNYRQKIHIKEDAVLLRKLKESETNLNTLIETIPDLLWLKDPEGRFLYCNPRIENLFNTSKMKIIGKTDYDFFDRSEADRFQEYDRRAMEQRQSVKNEEVVTYLSDGHKRTVETIKTPVIQEDGRISGILGISRDITARIESERNLRETKEWLQAFMDSTSDAIIIYDENDRVVQMNKKALSMDFRREDKNLMGLTLTEILAPFAEAKDLITERYNQVKKSGIPSYLETEIHYNEGPRWLSLRFFKIGRGLGVTTNDITEQKRLEEHVRQVQKIDSIGRLAGGVAHDFNNILGIITGFAELALMKTEGDNELSSYLNEILNAAEKSSGLTRQLLGFARKQSVSPRRMNLNDTVENMLKMLKSLIGEHIELNWKPEDGLWSVKMDPAQIDQIIANLCVNARDAIKQAGRITIRTENRILDEEYCAGHPEVIPGEYVCLSVTDNGVGMTQEVRGQIFEPFYTTKEIGKGTGLGLSTVYGIIRQNNGSVIVDSKPGEGSVFCIFIPRMVGNEADPESRDKQKTTGGSEKILIIEDEEILLKMMTLMLESSGYEVLSAGNPDEALHIARREAGTIDLILSDIIMPGMNGKELEEKIREWQPESEYLFMSGYTDDIIARQGILDEGIRFIQKPFSQADLTGMVRRILDGE